MKRLTIPLLLLTLTLVTAPAWAATGPKSVADPVAALLEQARDAKGKGDIELALRLAQSAIVADPARPGSYVVLGNLYAEQGEADYARNYYDEALAIDPAEPAALKAIAALESRTKAAAATP